MDDQGPRDVRHNLELSHERGGPTEGLRQALVKAGHDFAARHVGRVVAAVESGAIVEIPGPTWVTVRPARRRPSA